MYEDQKKRFFWNDVEEEDLSVIARRAKLNERTVKGIRTSMVISGLAVAFILTMLVLMEFVFEGTRGNILDINTYVPIIMIFLSLAFIIFVYIGVGHQISVTNKYPIAIKQNGDFAVDVITDNGTRRTINITEIASVSCFAGNSQFVISVSGPRNYTNTMTRSDRLVLKLKNGESITLHFIADGGEAKKKLDAFISEGINNSQF